MLIKKIKIIYNGMLAGYEILLQIKDHNLNFKEVEMHCDYDIMGTSNQNSVNLGIKVLLAICGNINLSRLIIL